MSAHEKEDLFSHLHINVSDEGFDLYDGLGRYFDDVVEFNGVKKRMEVTLVDLPPLLQLPSCIFEHSSAYLQHGQQWSVEEVSVAEIGPLE